jgi:hypothetical protein
MGHAVRDKSTARCWICPRGHAARRVCDKSGREGRIWADLPAQGRADPPPPNADPTPRRRARTRPPRRRARTRPPAAERGPDPRRQGPTRPPPPRPDGTPPAAETGPAANTCAFPGTLDKPSRLFRPKHPGPDVLGKLNPPARAFRVLQVSDRPSEAAPACFPSSAAFTPAPPRVVPGDRSG